MSGEQPTSIKVEIDQPTDKVVELKNKSNDNETQGISVIREPSKNTPQTPRIKSNSSSGSDDTLELQGTRKGGGISHQLPTKPIQKTHTKDTKHRNHPKNQPIPIHNNAKKNDFSAFLNPTKIKKERSEVSSFYSDDQTSQGDKSDRRSGYSSSEGGYSDDYSRGSRDDYSRSGYDDSEYSKSNSKPSRYNPQEEKQALLIKLFALESKGIKLSKDFSTKSSLQEIKMEYNKQKERLETEAGVKFSQRMLMACVTGLEFMNKRFDPVGAKLEGWSESVMENVNDYDGIFERLQEKYSGKGEVSPELELLLALAGSAFMFHLTQTFFKSQLPGFGNIAQQNPAFMQGLASAFSNMNQNNQNSQPGPMPSNIPSSQPMGPPHIDLSSILGQTIIGGNPMMNKRQFGNAMQNPPPPPMQTRNPIIIGKQQYKPPSGPNINDSDRFSIASSNSSLSSAGGTRNVSISKSKRKGKDGKQGFVIDLNS